MKQGVVGETTPKHFKKMELTQKEKDFLIELLKCGSFEISIKPRDNFSVDYKWYTIEVRYLKKDNRFNLISHVSNAFIEDSSIGELETFLHIGKEMLRQLIKHEDNENNNTGY